MRRPKKPQLVYNGRKVVSVILDIATYEEMLERLEDAEDLRMLEEMRSKPLHFHSLEEVLDELGVKV